MSDILKETAQGSCNSSEQAHISHVIKPAIKDLGGFSVRRLLPSDQQQMVGPFIFFDHLGPAEFEAGQGVDVRPHPHIGLATVTYLFDGQLQHRDSLGNIINIQPGAINLMTAGRGIAHSERTPKTLRDQQHRLHALQLWLALSDEQERCEPGFQHFAADHLPETEHQGSKMKLLMGNYAGMTSPVATDSQAIFADVELAPDKRLLLPEISESAIYIISGKLNYNDELFTSHQMLVIRPSLTDKITAIEPSRIVIIGGNPVGKRYIEWNFVASSRELIEQAKADWRQTHAPKVPGDDEFIPLPGE